MSSINALSQPQSVSSAALVEAPHTYTAERVPLALHVPERSLESLDPEQRACIESIIDLAESRLTEWETFHPDFPESRFGDGDPVVRMADLFKAPDNSELQRLVTDEEGNFLPLTPEQKAQIRRTGTFEIPSEDFPGQTHVWGVSPILQRGSDYIKERRDDRRGAIFDQLAVQVPERLSYDGDISVGRGLRNIYKGLRAIPAFAFGLHEVRSVHSPHSIDRGVELERQGVIHGLVTEHHGGDARLYDANKKTEKRLAAVLESLQARWNSYKGEHRAVWNQNLIETQGGKAESLRLKLAAIEADEYCAFVETDGDLEAAEPGYGNLLASARRAEEASEAFDRDVTELRAAERSRLEDQIRADHPIRSRSSQWFRNRVEAGLRAFEREAIWQALEEKATLYDAEERVLEAKVYRAVLEFHRTREPELEREMKAMVEPSRTFRVDRRTWRSSKWEKLEYGVGDETRYRANKDRTRVVRTDQLGWRIRLAAEQSFANTKNGFYGVVVSNMWNGPLGVRSLVGNEPFYAWKKMDADTGDIVDDPFSKTHTLRSRYRALWDGIAASRQAFEDSPDSGILPKTFSRGLHKIWHNGVRGVGGTVVLGAGQPAATALNLVASSVLAVTTPIWASIPPVARAVAAPFVYDANSPGESKNGRVRKYFPIVGHTVSDIGFRGIGQGVCALGSAALIHPGIAAATGIYSGIRNWTRTGYDFAMAHVILRRGRQPAANTWLNTRIRGPGLSRDYYFQLRPEIAVLALQAELERVELGYFEQNVTAAISEPAVQFREFFHKLTASLGQMKVGNSDTAKRLQANEDRLQKDFNKEMSERRDLLRSVSRVGEHELRIRQNEADLAETIGISTQLVESFYQERILPYLDERTELAFWNKAELRVGNFEGLAKYYLARVFSPNFLEPMEVTDETFVIDVSDPSAKEFIDTLVHPKV